MIKLFHDIRRNVLDLELGFWRWRHRNVKAEIIAARSPTVQVYKANDGWRWRLVAGNGEVMAHGEAYNTKRNVIRAISTIRTAFAIADVEEVKV